MRVIGGEFRSRRLKSLPGLNTRPTPDRLRETLFNVLAASIPGSVFMDVYAGTGAVAIEALSRGARRAILIENNRAAAEVIRENLAALGLERRAEVLMGKAAKVLERARADFAFLDPPYEMSKEYAASMAALDHAETPLVIVQHSARFTPQEAYGNLRRYREIKQGDNVLSLYQRQVDQDHNHGHSGQHEQSLL
ncbi:MAG: 16S rRNA (guanine(966)-N(2))-methyltransferase RsmD [Bryobacteraceae bacterium]|jgi:16S rRNA (guanine(966)-N(2))-methyltransferase RsmD